MTVRECYEKMGANYDGVLSRLGNEMLIRKFVIKFLKDPSFQDLTAAIEKSDAESAFFCGTYIERHLPEPGV